MKFFTKKIYIILFLLSILLIEPKVFAKDSKIQYTSENISNYFSGIISINQNHNNKAIKYLKKAESLKNKHTQFNIEFIRTLIQLGKIEKALAFSKEVWTEGELFFEADLLLGLNSFLKRDYIMAQKYFERLNKISRYNLFFDNFVGNTLIAWSRASQGDKEGSFKFLEKVPKSYGKLKKIQNVFLQCYFDDSEIQKSFEDLINDKDYNFSRYNFFLINYLLHENNTIKAKKIIESSRKKYNSNLLIEQTENFFFK